MISAFGGFKPPAFAFLRGLAEAQNREWFQAHKAEYQAHVYAPMAALLAELGFILHQRGLPLQSDPKRAVFRIHRDVRFSHDKRPYKTHIGAALTRSGVKMSPGLLYVHIDPEGCFAAAGFYRPEPRALAAIRDAIAEAPQAFAGVTRRLAGAGLDLSPDEEALKRTPRGFEHVTDAATLDALRRKSWIVRRKLTRAQVARPDLAAPIADFAIAAKPLLDFGWSAVDAGL
jgi:uncharacterized protein (TIGR02453 family)